MATDPYAAPRSRVADVPALADEGNFILDGQAVPAGNGWTWITDGWALFAKQPGIWIAIVVVFLIIFVVISLIPFVGGLAAALLGPVFAGGIMLGCRALDQGDELEFGHLFAGFGDPFRKLVLLGAVYLAALIVIVLVAALVGGFSVAAVLGGISAGDVERATIGGAALVIALLIGLALFVPVAMAMWFAPALIVFNHYGVTDAIKASFVGCLKNVVPFLVYGVIFLGLAIAATIPFGFGWLILGPTLAASIYASYRDIYYAG